VSEIGDSYYDAPGKNNGHRTPENLRRTLGWAHVKGHEGGEIGTNNRADGGISTNQPSEELATERALNLDGAKKRLDNYLKVKIAGAEKGD